MAASSAHVRLPRKTIILGALVPEQGPKKCKSLYRKENAERHTRLQPASEEVRRNGPRRSVSKAGIEISGSGCSDCVGVSADEGD
jgi:aconitase A